MKETLIDIRDPGEFARMQGKTAAVRDLLRTLDKQPMPIAQEK
jgi:hypothetical protein